MLVGICYKPVNGLVADQSQLASFDGCLGDGGAKEFIVITELIGQFDEAG
ncbi:MAG: hypothetical protein OSB69_13425 [Alphaproteobacteria bacterium]|nr:hypothetical protein [Alphaproteobacteria bacterium]